MEIAVSYLKSNDSKKKTISKIEKTSADYIHVDLMDGVFVPSKNFDILEVVNLLKDVKKPLDIHLMVIDPLIYLPYLASLNVNSVFISLEASNVLEGLKKIRNLGFKAGLAIKPDTSLDSLLPYYGSFDVLLIMSVNPGMGGQEFLSSSIDKLKQAFLLKSKYGFLVFVDGGINSSTVNLVRPYVDGVVSGSFVCMSFDYEASVKRLRYCN